MDNDPYIYKITIGQTIALAICIFVIAALSIWGNDRDENINCANYRTQHEAQLEYVGNTVRYAALDADNDGEACEDLPTKK